MTVPASGQVPIDLRSKLAIEQAAAELRGGNGLEAQRLLRKRLFQNPNDARALTMLAEIAVEDRRIEEATILLRRAWVAEPTPDRRLILLRHLQDRVSPAAALREIEDLPSHLRQTWDVQGMEAGMLGLLGIHDRQIAIYEKLTSLQPKAHAAWMTLGNAYKTVGRIDDAIQALRNAIKARPTYGEGYWTLANFKSFRFTDRDISAMKRMLTKKINAEDELHFHFALGKAFEEHNHYEPSFRHYTAGNRIRASQFSRDKMFVTAFVNNAIATYTQPLFDRHANGGCPASDPIFVLGLHRSGSTLVEQILASHPMIEGTTEIPAMQNIWDRIVRNARAAGRSGWHELASLTNEDFRAIGEEYLDRARPFRLSDRPMFVDKLPANWMNVGLIRLALPNAKIIDARRHPMACGFSNFKQNYASGIAYSYSLESIGAFYRDYWRFLNHIDSVQPGVIHRVINERLIDELETEVRRLLDYVGVPFDPACLAFHKTQRAVRTPSAEQVRRPINRDGVDYWRRYEPWLGKLKAALGPALDKWDKMSS